MLTITHPIIQASRREIPQAHCTLRFGIEECDNDERNVIDSLFSQQLTGLGWWRSLSTSFHGNEFSSVFCFIRNYENEIEAVVSALYFPKIQVLKMLTASDSKTQSSGLYSLLDRIKANCLLVNGLSACSSIGVKQNSNTCFSNTLNTFVSAFSRKHKVDGVLVRCIDNATANEIKQLQKESTSPWQVINGYPLNQVNFTGCNSLSDFIKTRMQTSRRTKIRASIKKLDRNSNYRIFRLRDLNTIEAYSEQIHSLYRDSYERNESTITFPVSPSPSFYTTLFQEYGEDRCYYYALVNAHNELIAFNIALRESIFSRGIAIGLKEPECRELDAWYNIMLALFDDLIKDGVTHLNMGNTHDDLKRRIGATQETQYAATYFPNRAYRAGMAKFILPKVEAI